jgi:hypothetical protein
LLGQEQMYFFTFKVWFWPVWAFLPVTSSYISCELTCQMSTHLLVVSSLLSYQSTYHLSADFCVCTITISTLFSSQPASFQSSCHLSAT